MPAKIIIIPALHGEYEITPHSIIYASPITA
jgi:hypothetical protein